MEFDFYLFKADIFALQFEMKNNVIVLKRLKNDFADDYKAKYVDLLFELYHNTYEFSNKVDGAFHNDNDEQMNSLLSCFERFINSYAKFLQYLDFCDVDCPAEIWKQFNEWKKKKLDLIEYLENK